MAILQKNSEDISLVMLDIVMPVMDGYEVLTVMNRSHLIDDIPVIIISSENAPAHIYRAYDMGVMDFINRPFDVNIVLHRVKNVILLSAKKGIWKFWLRTNFTKGKGLTALWFPF